MCSCSRLCIYLQTVCLWFVFFFFPGSMRYMIDVTSQLISMTARHPSVWDTTVLRHGWQYGSSKLITKLILFSFPLFWPVKTLELVRNFSVSFFPPRSFWFQWFCGMRYAPFGILLQKYVSLRFLLFPANKEIIETLPKLQLCFLLERLTDSAKQREYQNAKEHLLCYSLHTFNIYINSLD